MRILTGLHADLIYIGGFSAFFFFLSQSFKGPEAPKFIVDREAVDEIKKYQPGLVADYYYKEKYAK